MYVKKITKIINVQTSYIARKVRLMKKIKIMTIILVIIASLVGCSIEEQDGEVLGEQT